MIDFKKAVSYIRGELTKQKVRAVISDLYPRETLWRDIFGYAVEKGIVAEIRRSRSINSERYDYFVNNIIYGCRVQEKYAHKAIGILIDLYSKLDKGVKAPHYDDKEFDSDTRMDEVNSGKKGVDYVKFGDYSIRILSPTTASIERFFGDKEQEIVVPDEILGRRIIGLGSRAFAKISGITKAIISEGVQYLGAESFHKCSALREIVLPSTLSQLGSGVFSYTDIESVELPAHLTHIPDGAFRFCKRLKNIMIPERVSLIADYAFFGCEALSSVSISEGIEYIGNNVFDRCSSLKKLTLPKSLKVIMGTMKDHRKSKFNPNPEKAADFTIRCYQDSYAMAYAKSRGYCVESI